jgi:hypothetical protein
MSMDMGRSMDTMTTTRMPTTIMDMAAIMRTRR